MKTLILSIMTVGAKRIHLGFYAEPVHGGINTPNSDLSELQGGYGEGAPIQNDLKFEVVNRIISFSKLKEGWDGDGAATISNNVIDNSLSFYNCLSESIAKRIDPEDIYPSPHGTIYMEWQSGKKIIRIEIGDTMIGYKSKNLKNDLPSHRSNISNEIPIEWLRAFRELYSSKHEWSGV